ncbi:MAG TPA: hypothetical protein VGO31_02120 [Microbacteriaceae bacterium]|nr:hypothetical protein [Microbacteriaceae bacterium]
MSGAENITFAALWLLVGFLGLLVLVLYKQLDRLILREDTAGVSLLPTGSEMPDLQVLGAHGIELLEIPDHSSVWALAFVTTTCGACANFLRELQAIRRDFPTVVVVRGESLKDEPDDPQITCRWIAMPGDLPELFAVTVVPTIYVLKDRTILAGTVDGSAVGVRRVLDIAGSAHAAQTDQAHAGRAAAPNLG